MSLPRIAYLSLDFVQLLEAGLSMNNSPVTPKLRGPYGSAR